MIEAQKSKPGASQPLLYQIRIKGHLGGQWVNWIEELAILLEEDGTTVLEGPVTDQAALHGILKKVLDLGLPLLSVNPVRPTGSQTGSS